MITAISLTVNAVATTAIHRALKNPAVAKIVSSHNEAGYNDMVTVVLTPGYYTADGADEFVALTTEDLNAALAGVITDPPPSPCGDPDCADGVVDGGEYYTHSGGIAQLFYDCPVCRPGAVDEIPGIDEAMEYVGFYSHTGRLRSALFIIRSSTMFAMFTVTSQPVPTGETVDGEPVYARQQASTAINAAHIVAIEFRPSSTGTDLLIKTLDGDTWSFPGTDTNMAAAQEIIENANCQ